MDRKLLSIIIPCYNEEKTVETIYAAVTDVMTNGQCDYEILFVDDGSKDYTEQKVCGLAQKDGHVKYYSFSRNFGKEAAIYAGLNNARGDYVVIMRTVVPVQIIEYRSPKYMHMLTGKFIENWTENREYAIRKIIYKDSRIELVESIRNRFFKFQRTEWVRSLNEINIFYILVIWMVYTNKVNVDEDRYITNEQYLLENAIYEMDNLRDGYINDFVECVLHTCSKCEEIDYEKTVRIVNRRFDEKYKSIFMAIAICMNDIRGNLRELYDERSYLYSMLHDTSVTYANISRWINYLRR